jgi:hypothetical protein
LRAKARHKVIATMARHHYVPQSLLRGWATNGKLYAYYWEENAKQVIENAKASVASACQIPDLNTFFGTSKAQRDFPEVGFFAPKVDTPAADALRVLLETGVRALTPKQRTDWARLLVSFGVRTPETLRQMGPAETEKSFALIEAAAKGSPQDEAKVNKIVKANMNLFRRNFPLQAALEINTDPTKLQALDRMTWWIRKWDDDVILIGNRPLLSYPRQKYPCGIPLDSPDCLIALPIAPNAAFFACANPKTQAKMRRMAPSRLANLVNQEAILRATCVYARGGSHAEFISQRLEGKILGTWNGGDWIGT